MTRWQFLIIAVLIVVLALLLTYTGEAIAENKMLVEQLVFVLRVLEDAQEKAQLRQVELERQVYVCEH